MDQRAGEVLFLPEGWHHATLNSGETLAVAAQARVPRSPLLRAQEVSHSMRVAVRGAEAAAAAGGGGGDGGAPDARELIVLHQRMVRAFPNSSEAYVLFHRLLR